MILFNESQNVVCDGSKLSNQPSLQQSNSGKAFFAPALTRAQTLMSKHATYRPTLVFVSNGEDNSEKQDDAESAVSAMLAAAPEAGLEVYTIGIGEETDHEVLENMAAVTGGEYYRACKTEEMSEVFSGIAAECGALEDLTDRFSQVISSMVSNKIVVDHM